MKISVIMPVNLSPYTDGNFKSASQPEIKFVRAVGSFLEQTYNDAELIIVSDGDLKVMRIYESLWLNCSNIEFAMIPKQSQFAGLVRQTGIDIACGDIVCYLDADDKLGINHLKIINDNFDTEKYDWVYYNDYLIKSADFTVLTERNVQPVQSSIGTSSIAHKRSCNVVWGDGYGHDLVMILDYLLHRPGAKIATPQYYVCHCSGLNMDF